jgi:hypothetical protein
MSENVANVITLKPRNQGRFAHTVTQEDLLELMWRSRQFSEARQAWEEKREYIRAALAAGAAVQEGVHVAYLEEAEGGGFQMPRWKTTKLVVR